MKRSPFAVTLSAATLAGALLAIPTAASAKTETTPKTPPTWTMGVEVKVHSDMRKFPITVTDRNADWTETMYPGDSTYFKGNRSMVDDVELAVRANSASHEVDFSNPSVGSPNASVDGWLRYFSVNQEETWVTEKNKFYVKRHGDRDGHKQFELRISPRTFEHASS